MPFLSCFVITGIILVSGVVFHHLCFDSADWPKGGCMTCKNLSSMLTLIEATLYI